jgi:putative sterol carrier protein
MADAQTDFTTRLPAKLSGDPEKSKAINAIFLVKINGEGGGIWTIDCKENVGIHVGEAGKPDCTLELSSEDWKTISDNPSSAMQLYFQGKLKVAGNAMLATKLQSILG